MTTTHDERSKFIVFYYMITHLLVSALRLMFFFCWENLTLALAWPPNQKLRHKNHTTKNPSNTEVLSSYARC